MFGVEMCATEVCVTLRRGIRHPVQASAATRSIPVLGGEACSWYSVRGEFVCIARDWLVSLLGRPCSVCGDALIYERGRGNLVSQRIDNTVGRELDKVVPMNCWCSCAVSDANKWKII